MSEKPKKTFDPEAAVQQEEDIKNKERLETVREPRQKILDIFADRPEKEGKDKNEEAA